MCGGISPRTSGAAATLTRPLPPARHGCGPPARTANSATVKYTFVGMGVMNVKSDSVRSAAAFRRLPDSFSNSFPAIMDPPVHDARTRARAHRT